MKKLYYIFCLLVSIVFNVEAQRVDTVPNYVSDKLTNISNATLTSPNMITPLVNGVAYQSTSTVQTNWIQGKFYTNTLPNTIEVSETVTNFPAAVAGACGTELWLGYSTNSATLNAVSLSTLTTVIAGITTVQQYQLDAHIPSGGYWCFTNISTGIGNSSTFRVGSGQYTICP